MMIFDQKTQDTHAGGSGCGCAAVTLSAYILPKLASGEWKRVLFVPTGALMSTVSFNEERERSWNRAWDCVRTLLKRRRIWSM